MDTDTHTHTYPYPHTYIQHSQQTHAHTYTHIYIYTHVYPDTRYEGYIEDLPANLRVIMRETINGMGICGIFHVPWTK